MRKVIIPIFIFFIIIGGIYFTIQVTNQAKITKGEYESYVSNFEDIDISDWKNDLDRINNNFIYFGRSTCPDCTRFVPFLYEVSNSEDIKILYVDTENESELLNEIRSDLEIEWVPTLGYISNGQFYKLKKEKNILKEDILNFFDTYDKLE